MTEVDIQAETDTLIDQVSAGDAQVVESADVDGDGQNDAVTTNPRSHVSGAPAPHIV